MAVIKAQVRPELLSWARDRAKVTAEDAARAANVAVEVVRRGRAMTLHVALEPLRT